jgi:hypothetical protein
MTIYADTWKAHWDKDRHKKTTSLAYIDLDIAVRSIVEIYYRYYYLLKQGAVQFQL